VITRWADDDLLLMDREDLSAWTGRPVPTIRARCQPTACDIRTRRALYDAEGCQEALSHIKGRARLANR
jgi:hypothetical protein